MQKSITVPLAIGITAAALGVMYIQFAGGPNDATAAQPTARVATERMPMPAAERKDIVDTAVAAGKFKTLVTAVQAAGLVETLKGKGPFTVFAPTDEAFAKVPKETLDALLKDKKALAEVLTYHVVAGKVMAADLVKVPSANTVQGKPVKFAVKINDTTISKTDIECSNGVITSLTAF